jgi:hypothetical protein
MKKVVLFFALIFSGFISAQDNQAELIKEANVLLTDFDSIKTVDGWKAKMGQFTDLKAKYPGTWIPSYYISFCAVQASFVENEKAMEMKDSYIDLAENEWVGVESLCEQKDIVHVLNALIANARLGVDPQNRWQKYGKVFEENLKAAKEVNEANPHIYYLKGVALFYTPKMFGGGAKNALPYLEKAKERFEKLTTHSAEAPYWGEMYNTYFISECSKK